MSNIGGSLGDEISLDTGHTKREWNLKSYPTSISIGISFFYFHSSLFFKILDSFRKAGRDNVPAVTAKYKELLGGILYILEEYYIIKSQTLFQFSGSYKSAYGEVIKLFIFINNLILLFIN